MHFVIFATDKPGKEQEHRDAIGEYRAWLDHHPAHPDVIVHHAGPTLADDGQTVNGTLNVIEAPSLEAAQAFAADSPLRKRDIYAEFHIRAWDWRTGGSG